MSLLAPYGLFALLGIPVVVALHLFRRRPTARRVSALFLFADANVRSEAGRRRQPLRRSTSLWLELLAVILLALWLAEPRVGVSHDPPRVVVVLDGSASMLAIGQGGSSARQRAARAVERFLGELPSDAAVSLIVSGTRPEVISGPDARPGDARSALPRWLPRSTAHDPGPAVELALELGGESAEVLFVTDGDWREAPPRVRVLGFGSAAGNAAIVAARRLATEDGRARVLCEVASFGLRAHCKVRVLGGDGSERALREIELDDDTPRHVNFDLDADDSPWTLRIETEADALAIDDSCALPPPSRREVRIGSTLPAATRSALEIDRVVRALAGVTESSPDIADLLITDTPDEAARERASELVVRAHGGETDPWLGPFLVDRRDALANGLTLDGVLWVAGRGDLPGSKFVLAGDQPLASAEHTVDGRVRVHLELDPLRSNLQRSPDWPILLQNVVETVRSALPGAERTIVPVGSTARWRGVAVGEVVEGPDGKEVPAYGDKVRYFETREPGLYRVVDGRAVRGYVAAWFVDAGESELRTRHTFERVPTPPATTSVGHTAVGTDTERRFLVLLLLAVLLGDFAVTAFKRSGR